MSPRIPNLFIVGAMKSGTTSLHNYLAAHPDIFMSSLKEPQYFSGLSRPQQPMVSKTEQDYLDLFKEAKNEKFVGESSTDYSKIPEFPGVPARIAAFSPEARIIYIMRDPVERALSHYWERVKQYLEGRDLLTTIRNEPEIVAVGHYALQLKPYLNLFGPDRVYTLTLEALIADQESTLRALFEWLGVDPNFVVTDSGQYNPGQEQVSRFIGAPLVALLRQTPFWRLITAAIPPIAKRQLRKLTKPVPRTMDQADEAIEYLRPILLEQTEELCLLLNRQFPEWKTLYGRS
ncbi:MAG: sulfotransferase family protein [Prochlorothrix sp.]